jgi:16S rRNA (guanine527-N7)-methyltransferase
VGNGPREEKEALLSGARAIGVELKQRELGLLLRYADLVRHWNQKINLVSRKDIGNLIPGHIVDSLAGVPVVKRLCGVDPENEAVSLERQARGRSRDDTAPTHPPLLAGGDAQQGATPLRLFKVMDLGSGGGLPGIPLKICLPEIDLTLVESTKKKARFLEAAVRELGLEGVTVIDRHSREIEKDACHRGRYDLVTARAVAELKELVALAFPFLRPGGRLMAYKSLKAEEEIAAAAGLFNKVRGVIEKLPGQATGDVDKARHLVMVRKWK